MYVKPLAHKESNKSTDESLAKECLAYFNQHPSLQLQAELWTKILDLIQSPDAAGKTDVLPWWNLKMMRERFTVTERLRSLGQRPDLRQKITTELTGLKPKVARGKGGDPNYQSALIDGSVDDGDISLNDLERSFEPMIMSVYVFKDMFWKAFVKDALVKLIETNTAREKRFIVFLIEMALKERGRFDGRELKPILTHLDVRLAVDGNVWQRCVPTDKRVAVDRARLEQERQNPRNPFTAKQELDIVGLELLVNSLDLVEFVPVVKVLGTAMGFEELPADELAEDIAAVGASPK